MDARTASDAGELRRLLDTGGIRAVYQPIVDLQALEPVAYEALARGPAGSPLESPERLFPAAAAEGLLPEVDRACRAAAIDGAVRPVKTDPFTLFVNVEPAALDGTPLFELAQQERILRDRVRVVAELSERDLVARPTKLLAAIAWLRGRGVGISIDNVGTDRRMLGLMPFAAPDVVKLDRELVHDRPGAHAAIVAGALGAEAERSGAQILAEGIETEEHLRRALALGATLGQGWLFGRPDDLPEAPARRAVLRARRRPSAEVLRTPFRIVARGRELQRGSKRVLLAKSRRLEEQAAELGADAVLLSTFQDARFFEGATRERYARLAERAALVGALGTGISDDPAPRVRGAALADSDALRQEWTVIVLGPHFAAAFAARDLGDEGTPDESRRFEMALTYERDTVVAAARSLMGKLVPQVAPADEAAVWLGPLSGAASRA